MADMEVNTGCPLAADVARTLDQACIPSLLWGVLAVGLVGDALETEEIEFIIADHQLSSAAAVLSRSGFPLCNNVECSHRPVADAHFHLEGVDPNWSLLSLFKKSKTVWWLPEFKLDPPALDDPHLTLSNDQRLPPFLPRSCGPWESLYPIKIMHPSSLVEAVTLLICRDIDQPDGFFPRWKDWIACLLDNPSPRRDPEYQITKTVRPDFQRFWQVMNSRTPSLNPWWPVYELQYDLEEKGELPPPQAIDE